MVHIEKELGASRFRASYVKRDDGTKRKKIINCELSESLSNQSSTTLCTILNQFTQHAREQLTSIRHAKSSNFVTNLVLGLSNFIGNTTVSCALDRCAIAALEGGIARWISRSL